MAKCGRYPHLLWPSHGQPHHQNRNRWLVGFRSGSGLRVMENGSRLTSTERPATFQGKRSKYAPELNGNESLARPESGILIHRTFAGPNRIRSTLPRQSSPELGGNDVAIRVAQGGRRRIFAGDDNSGGSNVFDPHCLSALHRPW